MDKRDIERMNIKFGKFLDPFLMLAIIMIISISLLSVRSLSPRAFSQEEFNSVLGVQEKSKGEVNFVQGEHRYITSEELKQINPTHFKYTTFVKKPPKGRISKPILELEKFGSETTLRIQLTYTNSNNSKISIFDEKNKTNYILQEGNRKYTQDIKLNNSHTLHLAVENTKPVFFDQYIELNFLLND